MKTPLKTILWIYLALSKTEIANCGSYSFGYGSGDGIGNIYSQTRTSRFVDDNSKPYNKISTTIEEPHTVGILEDIHSLGGSIVAKLNRGILGEGGSGLSLQKDFEINVGQDTLPKLINDGAEVKVQLEHGNLEQQGSGSTGTYHQSHLDEHNGAQSGIQVNIKADISGRPNPILDGLIEKAFKKSSDLELIGIREGRTSNTETTASTYGVNSSPHYFDYDTTIGGITSGGSQTEADYTSSSHQSYAGSGQEGSAVDTNGSVNTYVDTLIDSAGDSYEVGKQNNAFRKRTELSPNVGYGNGPESGSRSMVSEDVLNGAGGSIETLVRDLNSENNGNRNIYRIKEQNADSSNVRKYESQNVHSLTEYPRDSSIELEAVRDRKKQETSATSRGKTRSEATSDLTISQTDHFHQIPLGHGYGADTDDHESIENIGNRGTTTFRKEKIFSSSQIERNGGINTEVTGDGTKFQGHFANTHLDEQSENDFSGRRSTEFRKQLRVTATSTEGDERIDDGRTALTSKVAYFPDTSRTRYQEGTTDYDKRITDIGDTSYNLKLNTQLPDSQDYDLNERRISSEGRPFSIRKVTTITTSQGRGDGDSDASTPSGGNTYLTSSQNSQLEYIDSARSEGTELNGHGSIPSSHIGKETGYKNEPIGQSAINTGSNTYASESQSDRFFDTSSELGYEMGTDESDESEESREVEDHDYHSFEKEVVSTSSDEQGWKGNYGSKVVGHSVESNNKEAVKTALNSGWLDRRKINGEFGQGQSLSISTSQLGGSLNAGREYTPKRRVTDDHGITVSDHNHNIGPNGPQSGAQGYTILRKEVTTITENKPSKELMYKEEHLHDPILKDETDHNIAQQHFRVLGSQKNIDDHIGSSTSHHGRNHGITFRKGTRSQGNTRSGFEVGREPKLSSGYNHNIEAHDVSNPEFGNFGSSTDKREIASNSQTRRNAYGIYVSNSSNRRIGTLGTERYNGGGHSRYGVPQEYNDNGYSQIRKEVTVTTSQVGNGAQVGEELKTNTGITSAKFDLNTNFDGATNKRVLDYGHGVLSNTGGYRSSGSEYGSSADEQMKHSIGHLNDGISIKSNKATEHTAHSFSRITEGTADNTDRTVELKNQFGFNDNQRGGIIGSNSFNTQFRGPNRPQLDSTSIGYHDIDLPKNVFLRTTTTLVDAMRNAAQPTGETILIKATELPFVPEEIFNGRHLNSNINGGYSGSVAINPSRSFGGYGTSSTFGHPEITTDINNESFNGRNIGGLPKLESQSSGSAESKNVRTGLSFDVRNSQDGEDLNPKQELKGRLNLGLILG